MTDVFRDLCSSLIYLLETHCRAEDLAINDVASTMDRARAALSAAPAPAAITTNALLHPAYEPGDGSMDGAQLVNSEWWHPVFGCDSLQRVVDNARAIVQQSGAAPTTAAEGEIAELARLLRLDAESERQDGMPQAAARFTRAANLLEQRHAPEPVGDGVTDEALIHCYQRAYEPAWKRGEYFGCHVDGLRAVLTRYGNRAPTPQSLPPDYIGQEITGADRELLERYYAATLSEGGSADEVILRGLRAVLPTDDAAAKPTTLTGWVSRDGRFYVGDNAESIARWSGATHVPCRHCGAPTPKHWTVCEPCRDTADQLRWDALPERDPADGEPIYSDAFDEYHYSIDSAIDDAYERDVPLERLRLLCCEPVYAKPIDSEWWSDDLPEDQEAPTTLLDAIDVFNRTISGLSLSWKPGKHRVKLPLPEVEA